MIGITPSRPFIRPRTPEELLRLTDRTLGETIEVRTVVPHDVPCALVDPGQLQNAILGSLESIDSLAESTAGLIEGINDGLSFQTLLGVTGSGKTYTMANVIAQLGRQRREPVHGRLVVVRVVAYLT